MNLKGKKLTAVMLAASMLTALASCGSDAGNNEGEAPWGIEGNVPSIKEGIMAGTTDSPQNDQNNSVSIKNGNVNNNSKITVRSDEPEEAQTAPGTSLTSAAAEISSAAVETVTAVPESTTKPSIYADNGDLNVRGNIYDSNGHLLIYSDRGKRVSSEAYKIPLANILNEASNGIDYIFNETLRAKNPTSVSGSENIGQSIQLTIDADLQNKIYKYMEDENIVGSVVVMRTDGSIMSEVSYPSYDPELYQSDAEYAASLDWETMSNMAFQNAAPGSCFKIMSEVIADKNGITALYDDGVWEDGAVIVNWDHDTNPNYPIDGRTLYSAFVNSSNIYFAKVFDMLGADLVFSELNEMFHFGTGNPVCCDFGTLDNSIEVYSQDDLRRSAFGQAYVLTCPLYLAALGREAVFGDMVKPFVLKRVVDTNDVNVTVSQGSAAYDVVASIPEQYRQNLIDGMKGVASNLGIYVPENYTLYAKTGTAETGADDILYITGCLKNVNDKTNEKIVYTNYNDYKSNGSYIVVMQIRNPSDHEFDFASESASLYKGILDLIVY